MTEIGKIAPTVPVVTRIPREHPDADEEKQQQEPGQESDGKSEHDGDEPDAHDKDGGIDLYV